MDLSHVPEHAISEPALPPPLKQCGREHLSASRRHGASPTDQACQEPRGGAGKLEAGRPVEKKQKRRRQKSRPDQSARGRGRLQAWQPLGDVMAVCQWERSSARPRSAKCGAQRVTPQQQSGCGPESYWHLRVIAGVITRTGRVLPPMADGEDEGHDDSFAVRCIRMLYCDARVGRGTWD